MPLDKRQAKAHTKNMTHKHQPVNKIWSTEMRSWLYGKYCLICEKDLRPKKEQMKEFENVKCIITKGVTI